LDKLAEGETCNAQKLNKLVGEIDSLSRGQLDMQLKEHSHIDLPLSTKTNYLKALYSDMARIQSDPPPGELKKGNLNLPVTKNSIVEHSVNTINKRKLNIVVSGLTCQKDEDEDKNMFMVKLH